MVLRMHYVEMKITRGLLCLTPGQGTGNQCWHLGKMDLRNVDGHNGI